MKNLAFLLTFSLILTLSCKQGGGGSGGSTVCDNISGGTSSGSSCPLQQPVQEPSPSELSLLETMPLSGSSQIAVGSSIEITFNNSINDSSIIHNSILDGLDNTVEIYKSVDGSQVLVNAYAQGNKIVIDPDLDLESGVEYTVKVQNIEDSFGNVYAGPHTFRFLTAAQGGSNPSNRQSVSFDQYQNFAGEVTHFILYYGDQSAKTKYNTATGEYEVDQNYKYQHEKIIRPEGLDGASAGLRSYYYAFDDTINQNLTKGVTNYFALKACNNSMCSVYSNEKESYIE